MSSYQCGGRPINCSYAFWHNTPIPSDSDIAGVGVLLSFIVTTAITIFAVILAYVTDSLPQQTYNPIDEYLLGKLHASWHFTCRYLGLPPIRTRKETRLIATQRFILALSDQQLVTGIAILVTVFIKRCTTSSWNYELVLDLAWFSALTHMATLIVLREYLSKNPRTRLWRVLAMSCMLIMLVVFMVLGSFVNWPEYPAMPLQCQMISPTRFAYLDTGGVLSVIAVVLFWAIYFGGNLLAVSSNYRTTLLRWMERIYWRRWKKQKKPDRVLAFKQKVEVYSKNHSLRRPQWVDLKCVLIYYRFIRAGFAQSFLWEILWMLALYGFCIGGLAADRWYPASWSTAAVTFEAGDNDLGFGQIVAIFLIALPFLGLIEAFTEAKGEDTQADPCTTQSSSPSSVALHEQPQTISIDMSPKSKHSVSAAEIYRAGIEQQIAAASICLNCVDLEAQVEVKPNRHSRLTESSQILMKSPDRSSISVTTTSIISTDAENGVELQSRPTLGTGAPSALVYGTEPSSSTDPEQTAFMTSSTLDPNIYRHSTIPKVFRFTQANNPYSSPFIGYYLAFLIVCTLIGFGLAEIFFSAPTSGLAELITLGIGLILGFISGLPSMG